MQSSVRWISFRILDTTLLCVLRFDPSVKRYLLDDKTIYRIWGPPSRNLKRIMVFSQKVSTFSQVARTVIAPVERVALPHRMWRWMGRAEGASMSILSTRWAPTTSSN